MVQAKYVKCVFFVQIELCSVWVFNAYCELQRLSKHLSLTL